MNFNMYQSVYKTEYFLDPLITRESLKLVDKILNQFKQQYYLIFFLIVWEKFDAYRGTIELNISLNMKIYEVLKSHRIGKIIYQILGYL